MVAAIETDPRPPAAPAGSPVAPLRVPAAAPAAPAPAAGPPVGAPAPAVPARAVRPLALTAEQAEHDRLIDRGFFRAVGIGSSAGILTFGAMVFLMLRIVDPTMEVGAAFGTAVWVGIWGGLFLGGTITVGLFSKKLH